MLSVEMAKRSANSDMAPGKTQSHSSVHSINSMRVPF